MPVCEQVLFIFTQAVHTGTPKGPEHHTYTRVLCTVAMADLQMKLLRKKIQKRNEKNKERKLVRTQAEDEVTGTCCK